MLALGDVIWVSFRPLLRLVICTSFGFVVTRAGIFPLEAARGAGQVMLNIFLPSLMFSKIVPAFAPQNAKTLGPLIFVSIFYEALGIAFAWIVKQFFWVPHRFRYGIIVAGGWANYGDIPTSVLMSITSAAPFNGASDSNLAVAYLAAFLLIFCVTLFPMGGHRLIAMDYMGPDIQDEQLIMSVPSKCKQSLHQWSYHTRDLFSRRSRGLRVEETSIDSPGVETPRMFEIDEKNPSVDPSESKHLSGQEASFSREDDITLPTSRRDSNTIEDLKNVDQRRSFNITSSISRHAESSQFASPNQTLVSRRRRLLRKSWIILKSFMTPPTMSILVSFPVALIQPLKALFTSIPNSPIPNAPDGQPPLAFVLDTASFVGAASVPVSLICLGSALARLHIPRSKWSSLPIGAIAWLAIMKMLVMPVIGVAFTQGLVSSGIIDAQDKVLRLVCIFMSCVPTATTQVFLTQVYSGTGRADHVSAFLIPQYAIMLVSMTALIAYTLSLLFE